MEIAKDAASTRRNQQPKEAASSPKDKNWIKLLKPRKLITIHLLHFLRKKPESSEKSLWNHLDKVFSFEDKASEDGLRGHHALIRQFVERDDPLEKSQLLPMFLKEGPKKRISGEDIKNNGDAKKFIDDDEVDDIMMVDDGDAEEESYLFDSVCAICDNGGELLCCEEKCLRSFHATKSAGIDSECRSLGYTSAQVEAIQNFYCENCQYNQHQCFSCGKLGSSDKALGAESKLRVYLAPFLHGARYTSFGHQFTKLDKLVEIVDTLQWYVHNDDMIVDFCCGSNDFSLLMKEKMDAVRKKCSFQNYDVIQPKNDFCFERRDWMTVEPKELPDGSQLIMELNPPFGVKASLANNSSTKL